MQPLRRWVPPSAKKTVAVPTRIANDRQCDGPVEISDQDLAFCAEFEANGGVAASDEGFKAEGDLIRMEQSGLLNLVRSDRAPFAVIRVRLSAGAYRLLGRDKASIGVAGVASPRHGRSESAASTDSKRHGFEIARGMIAAAIKTEMSGMGGLPPAAAARLMERISRMPIPF